MKTPVFPTLAVPILISLSASLCSAGIISYLPITADGDSGIDPSNTYTHAIDFGTSGPATVNGVEFSDGNPGEFPGAVGSSTIGTGSSTLPDDHPGNGGQNVGGNVAALLQDMLYNDATGEVQLTGLTPGITYDFRYYMRQWTDQITRQQDFLFDGDGDNVFEDSVTISQDDATQAPPSLGAANQAYALSYVYTAGASGTLNLQINQTPTGGGTFHLYGLTNQIAPGFSITVAPLEFSSAVTQGDFVADLIGLLVGVEEATTFEFATGEGDDDNSLFQISGQELQAGAFDFSGDPNGTEYSVRLRGTGDVSMESAESSFVLTLSADSDTDDLPDAWELTYADDLTELSGLGGANFDMDSLTDLEEFQISESSFPDINPKLADTDSDGLEDGAEIDGAGDRPATDPTNPDSDGDGLDDAVETNTGTLVSETNIGTDPTDADTDGDTFSDGIEVAAGSDPHDPDSIPPLPPGFGLSGPITDIASADITPDKDYSHAISGGSAQTVNGVAFELLDPNTTPANFNWDTAEWTKSQVMNNPGDWLPEITEPNLLGLFTDFTYSGSGANPGSNQTFTLSGLTPGVTYEARVHIRIWDTQGSGRPIALTFTNGDEVASPSPPEGVPEDRPGDVLGTANPHDAYYLSYTYTAETDQMSIFAQVPDSAPNNSGSFHLYALTNHVTSPPVEFKITDISYSGGETPSVSITFNSRPGATYGIYASTSMLESGPGGWIELDDSYMSGGDQTTFVDTQAVGAGPRVFYQVREAP
ncbi:MAG: hypothetical protein ACR2RV_06150 [Verrucomicrobiales bacterium]